jgi:hypothetical protein
MSRQAEAERERRARVIAADGEFQASTKLSQAADAMSGTPGALQLRLLQTVVDVAAEKNSTLVMPFPVELLRFFESASGHAAGTVTGSTTGAAPDTRPAPETAGPSPVENAPAAIAPETAFPTEPEIAPENETRPTANGRVPDPRPGPV